MIFISIDENEFAQLKLLCDEIFSEENFVENFIWKKNSTKNLSKTTSTNHEYVLTYSKNKKEIEKLELFRIKKEGLDEVKNLLLKSQKLNLSKEETQKILRDFYKQNPNLKGISMYNNIELDVDKDKYLAYRLSDISAPKAT
ncbi:MAG: hypothetical protein LBQ24_05395 [Candidatus Peribacteria bacterium]|nr:hypothetical protein [Candidatus Peribacteria bacterium]